MPNLERLVIPVDIANGATESEAVDIRGHTPTKESGLLVGVEMPATFTGTTIRFKAAATSEATKQSVYTDGGVELSLTVAQGRYVAILQPIDLASLSHFVLVVDAQGAARVVRLVVLRD